MQNFQMPGIMQGQMGGGMSPLALSQMAEQQFYQRLQDARARGGFAPQPMMPFPQAPAQQPGAMNGMGGLGGLGGMMSALNGFGGMAGKGGYSPRYETTAYSPGGLLSGLFGMGGGAKGPGVQPEALTGLLGGMGGI